MAHNIDLPRHRYVHVIESAVHRGGAKDKTLPCVWWGLSATPGRMFGCHILLESGAMVVDLPLHALRHKADATQLWTCDKAQRWDAYGWSIEAHEPAYLTGLDCRVLTDDHRHVADMVDRLQRNEVRQIGALRHHQQVDAAGLQDAGVAERVEGDGGGRLGAVRHPGGVAQVHEPLRGERRGQFPQHLVGARVADLHERALPWLAWGHLVLTGSLMYLFLRRQRLHELACVLGGGLWLLNGYGLVWLENRVGKPA